MVFYGNYKNCLKSTEAVVWSFSVEKVFLEISQNSLGTTCARVSFLNKVAGLSLFCEISKNNYFYRTTPVAASESTRKYILQKSFSFKW